MSDEPLLPDYEGACITNVVPALLHLGAPAPSWLPAFASDAERVVLLVIDGLGWNQLASRRRLAPTLAGLDGGAITTVAPSTTATALDVDQHGPAAGRARGDGLPDRRAR